MGRSRSRSPASRVGFMVGLWAWRLFENRALRRLAAGLAAHPPALSLRRDVRAPVGVDGSIAGDPAQATRRAGRLGRHAGEARRASASNGGARCVTEISGDDGRVVAVVHDAALRGRPDVPRRRARLGAEGARARAPRRRVAQLAARAQGLPCTHHVERGQGAPADRARPSRRRPAVPGRPADPARAGRRAAEGKPGPRRAAAGRARHARSTRRSNRSGRWRAGVYPSLLADRGLARGAARCRAAQPGPDHRRRGRHRALQPGDRGRGLLLLSRGDAERDEARGRRRDDLRVALGRERGSPLRGAATTARVRRG